MIVVGYVFQFCIRASAGSNSGGEEGTVVQKDQDGWKIDFSGEKPATPLLDTVNYPVHMKNLSSQVITKMVIIVYGIVKSYVEKESFCFFCSYFVVSLIRKEVFCFINCYFVFIDNF